MAGFRPAPLEKDRGHQTPQGWVSVRTIQTWLGHDDNFFIHSGALRQLTAQLTALRGSLMDVARFKQLTGLSRKYAIPLLEYLDRQRITRIQGDQRLVL